MKIPPKESFSKITKSSSTPRTLLPTRLSTKQQYKNTWRTLKDPCKITSTICSSHDTPKMLTHCFQDFPRSCERVKADLKRTQALSMWSLCWYRKKRQSEGCWMLFWATRREACRWKNNAVPSQTTTAATILSGSLAPKSTKIIRINSNSLRSTCLRFLRPGTHSHLHPKNKTAAALPRKIAYYSDHSCFN